MADLKLTADESKIIEALDNIEKGFVAAATQADLSSKKIGESFNETEADVRRAAQSLEEYKQAQDRLAAGAQSRVAGNKALQESLAKYRREQQEMNKAMEDGAKKNVESAKSIQVNAGALKNNADQAASASKSVGGLAGAAGGFLRVLGPIGVAIGAVIAFLSKFQEGMDFVSRVTAGVSAAFTVLTQRLVLLGSSFKEFLSGNFQLAAIDFAAATDNLAGAIVDAATAASDLEGRVQKLRDAQLDAAVSGLKMAAASEKAQALASQESRSFNERIAALRTAIGLESSLASLRIGFAQQDAALAREAFALSSKGVSDKESLIEKEAALIEVVNAADRTRIELLGQLNQLEKERTEFIRKNLEEVTKLIDKLDVSLQEDQTAQKIEQINQGVEQQVQAIEAGIEKINEVQRLRPLSSDEIAQRQNLQDKLVGVIEQGEKQKLDAILDGVKRELEIEDKRKEAAKATAEKRTDDARAALKDLLDLQNQQISITEAEFDNLVAVLRAGGAKEQDIKTAQNEFDKRIKAERLEAELQYQRGLAALAGDGVEADTIRARIQELEVLLEGIDIPTPKDKGGKPKSIFEILGLDSFLDDEQQKAVAEAIGRLVDSLGQLSQARVDEAEAASDAAQKKVDEAQKSLDEELEIAEKGQANFSDLRKKELADAKAARDAALKEETKAKKAQVALDTVTQSVGLITSSVNIFKSLSSLGPIGIGLAVVTIGTMLAAFAATKAKALKAAEPPKLRKGDKIIGRTHEQGGELRELEHGEQVVGAGEAAGQDLFFERMRKGKYKGLDLAAIAESRGDYQSPISGASARAVALGNRRDRASEAMQYNALSKAYEKVGDKIIEAIDKKPIAAPWKGGYKLIEKKSSGTDITNYQPAD